MSTEATNVIVLEERNTEGNLTAAQRTAAEAWAARQDATVEWVQDLGLVDTRAAELRLHGYNVLAVDGDDLVEAIYG